MIHPPQNQNGFIKIPILVAVIVGLFVVGGVGYLGLNQYKNYQIAKTEKQEQEQALFERQQQDLEKTKEELEKAQEEIKNQQINKFENYEQKIQEWSIHKNEDLGYIMEYPQDWNIVSTYENYGIVLSGAIFQSNDYKEKSLERPEGAEGLYREIIITQGVDLGYSIIGMPANPNWCIGIFDHNPQKCTWRERAIGPTDAPYGRIISQEFIEINGREVYKKEVEYQDVISIVISLPNLKEDLLFRSTMNTLKKDRAKNLKIFESMISALKFYN